MNTRCGYVALAGRPNVGKSTLLNAILGQKISITSRRPQTTRHNLLGIRTADDWQALFVDTPGIHGRQPRAINRYMNHSARRALRDVDVLLFLVDRNRWTEDDEAVGVLFGRSSAAKILVVNKIDRLRSKSALLPLLQSLQEKFPDAALAPVSAATGENLPTLERLVSTSLPESPFYFDGEQVTDRSERFLAAEIIREKLMRQLGDELPYAAAIHIDRFEYGEAALYIDATIFVETEGQKRILIGKGGERLKRIGSDARVDVQRLLDARVVLNTWVRVRAGWSDDERAMKSLGYDDAR